MIRYDPSSLINKIAPARKVKKLIKADATIKKTALSFVDDVPKYLTGVIDKKDVSSVALKVAKAYKKRIKQDKAEKKEIKKDPALLIQRVQNEIVSQLKEEIAVKYDGEFYIWTTSDAMEPDPEHQLNYGKKFQIGVGEMPGDRYGCRCGMDILVDEKQLDLQP